LQWLRAGGGYAYSVCPKRTPPTETCFGLRAHMLDFVGSNHTIRYSDGRPDIQIPARDVSEGTFPAGSQWRVNPIPACNCDQVCSPRGVLARLCRVRSIEFDWECPTWLAPGAPVCHDAKMRAPAAWPGVRLLGLTRPAHASTVPSPRHQYGDRNSGLTDISLRF
jgi:hypothetical protein